MYFPKVIWISISRTDVVTLNRESPDFLERHFSNDIIVYAINIDQSEKTELVESVLLTANAQLLHAYHGWLPFDVNLYEG